MNAVCGFGSIYVASLGTSGSAGDDPLTQFFARHHFVVAVYLIYFAMLWDAIDGRLARFTRHTTDFGGQLDSLADVISFGAAPAFLALQVFKTDVLQTLPPEVTRLVWGIGALYLSCAAMRLARFNVSNEHGEQHHFSFLGLPSPGAGGCVAGVVLMQQMMVHRPGWVGTVGMVLTYAVPVVVLMCGLLMVSSIRYAHVVNRYLRGQRSLGRLVFVTSIVLLLVVAHQYVIGAGMLIYVLGGLVEWMLARGRRSYRGVGVGGSVAVNRPPTELR
jgi:CDP-diacylglycerol--serine O-phosphatidyltransferase